MGLNQVLDVDSIICLEIRSLTVAPLCKFQGTLRPCRSMEKLSADADKPWEEDKMR